MFGFVSFLCCFIAALQAANGSFVPVCQLTSNRNALGPKLAYFSLGIFDFRGGKHREQKLHFFLQGTLRPASKPGQARANERWKDIDLYLRLQFGRENFC
ncbi:hypothetical protein OS493_034554 [Desmophyllum pertusum]|uniref:Secreted protein n=1 Tax=Desmophyllum pertusum TaxID=174260 RepID=A0A9X0CCW1_9CNID|nr:hypothetical protein OS493_034554 [Desmophyllum pertusum]